ncbi:MAG: DUF3298 domain-containing protein [Rhizomicrobium sp.]
MRLALIALAAMFAVTPALAKLPFKTVKIAEKHKDYEIDVAYPRTGHRNIDADMAGWVKAVVADFRGEAQGNGGDGSAGPYTLDITFTVPRNDDKVFAVVFEEGIFEGGAHPNSFFNTMNFLMPEGGQVYLPEIFKPEGLKVISKLAIADLRRQLTPDQGFDAQMITDGAGPEWSNFADFTILPDVLDIQYPPYAVAPYVAGSQETKIPLSALKAYMRPDWRAPQASFDCTEANAWVEKMICSDVTLARLDRDVADAYALAFKNAGSDAARLPVHGDQRAFLAERMRRCGGHAGAGAITCLIGLYRMRLKALNTPPQ